MNGGSCHWTDSYGYQICPICDINTPENELIVKTLEMITTIKENYKLRQTELTITRLERELNLAKGLLKRIKDDK